MNPANLRKIALDIAREKGLINVTRGDICKRASVATGSFQHFAGESFTAFIEGLQETCEANGWIQPSGGNVDRKRAVPALRKANILSAAVKIAREDYGKLTRDRVAAEAKISTGLVSQYYKTMQDLRDAVMLSAVEDKDATILAAGIAAGSSIAKGAPKKLKQEAVKILVNA